MCLLLALAAATPDVPPAPPPPPVVATAVIDDTLEVSGESIAARQVLTRMTIPVTINGRGPYRFVVDSGADRSVIGDILARRLHLPRGRPLVVHNMAGTSMAPRVEIAQLGVGASTLFDLTLPALPEAALGAEGLIGIDALAGQRLMLDFERKTITLQDPRTATPGGPDEIVVTARRRRGQLILTQATVGTQRVSAVLDTGTQVTVGNDALAACVLRGRRPLATRPVTLISVTGQEITAALAIVPEVRIGGVALRNVPIAFSEAPPFALFGLSRTPALLLGTDLLQSFRRVALDFARRRVRFTFRR